MNQDYDLIIFDCDGTLVDSETICNQSLVDIVNQYVEEKYSLHHALEKWAGRTVSDVLKIVEGERSVSLPDHIPQLYVENCNAALKRNLNSVSGSLDCVSACHHKGIKICVGSNGERQNVLDSLEMGGFSPTYFKENTTFTRIQVPKGKPAPDLFLFAAQEMGVDPNNSRCLVIEDSIAGVQAGVAAGMEVWGFVGVSHNKESQEAILKKAGAKRVFDRFIHIAEALGV